MKRVGLLGGTFDPPHLGHLVVAVETLEQADLDEVRLVVANDPWQKADRAVTPAADRLRLVELAVAELDGVVASDVEIRRGGATYTIDTLEHSAAEEPGVEWSVIVGADAAAGLETWHRAEELRDLASFVVVNRGDDDRDVPPGWRSTRVEIPGIDVSSTLLRERLATGRSVRLLTPDAVITEIERRGLYLRIS